MVLVLVKEYNVDTKMNSSKINVPSEREPKRTNGSSVGSAAYNNSPASKT